MSFTLENFKEFVNTLVPTFEDTKYGEPRIVIPLIYEKKSRLVFRVDLWIF